MTQTVTTILGTTVAVGTISSLFWWYYFTISNKQNNPATTGGTNKDDDNHMMNRQDQQQLQQSISNFNQSQHFKPPFPPKIRAMLSKCRLAYLSTVDAGSSTSHLSLMRFTYLHDPTDGEIVVMSTNKKTKKFEMLAQQSGVALLVHDFVKLPEDYGNGDDDGSSSGGTYSMTLNGQCRILENGTAKAERYRQAHLDHNPDYPQFIVGPDIVMLCIDVTSARICDIQDQVTKWNVQEGFSS